VIEIVGVAVGNAEGCGDGVLDTIGVLDGVIDTVCVGVGVGGISFHPMFLLSSETFTYNFPSSVVMSFPCRPKTEEFGFP
jgi:hypothetical protein